MNLEKVQLNENAIEYIRAELAQGDIFSKYLLTIDLHEGEVYTYMPLSIKISSSFDLGDSIAYNFGVMVGAEFHLLLSEMINRYLDLDPTKYAVFETLAVLGDPSIDKSQTDYFFVDGRKYCFIRGSDGIKSIDNCRREAQGYPFVTALIKILDENQYISQKMNYSEEELNNLRTRVDGLVIGAFDGEGYIFWTRLINGTPYP